MARDSTLRADVLPDEPSQADYDAICAAMSESARGRWFLAEYAARNRSADTVTVLHAIDQIGATLRGEALPPSAPEYLHLGLMAMAGLVASVETDMSALATGHETEAGARPRIRRIIGTLRDLGDCIQVMLDGWTTPPAPVATPPAAIQAPATAPTLTLVETAKANPAEDQAGDDAGSPDEAMAAEYESDFVPFELDAPDEVTTSIMPLPPLGQPAQTEPLPDVTPPDDPLAPLRALNRAELIALFT